MGVWGPCTSTCLGGAGWSAGGPAYALAVLALVIVGAAGLGARWSRARIARRFDRRIAEVYERVRAKAEAARRADYAQTPAEAFALYHLLRDELFEVAGVGAAVQAIKDAVVAAAAQPSAPPSSGVVPVKGAMVLTRLPPPAPDSFPPAPAGTDPHAALRRAVDEFWDYWSNRPRVERQLRQAVRSLGGEEVVREPRAPRRAASTPGSAGDAPRARSAAAPRSRPASP